MSSVVTSVASTVIAAAIVWIASETHQHDIALVKQGDTLDRIEDTTKLHTGALKSLTDEITGEPDGLKAKTRWLHNTLIDNNKKSQDAIAGVSSDIADVKKERDTTNKTILDKLDKLDSRLTKVDGDHGKPYDADGPPH